MIHHIVMDSPCVIGYLLIYESVKKNEKLQCNQISSNVVYFLTVSQLQDFMNRKPNIVISSENDCHLIILDHSKLPVSPSDVKFYFIYFYLFINSINNKINKVNSQVSSQCNYCYKVQIFQNRRLLSTGTLWLITNPLATV